MNGIAGSSASAKVFIAPHRCKPSGHQAAISLSREKGKPHCADFTSRRRAASSMQKVSNAMMLAVPDETSMSSSPVSPEVRNILGGIWLHPVRTVGWSSTSLHSTISPIVISTSWRRHGLGTPFTGQNCGRSHSNCVAMEACMASRNIAAPGSGVLARSSGLTILANE